jgi:hypothetical protein
MVARMPNRQYAYFRDDQITFLMTHGQPQLPETDLRDWRDAIEPFLDGAKIVWPPRCFSFRALEDNEYQPSEEGPRGFTRAFSLLNCDMENVPLDPLDFLEFIVELSNPDRPNDPNHPHRLLIGQEFAGLRLEAISPNWLASGASQAGGTGGPGSWPVPYRGNSSRAPYQFRDLISSLKDLEIYGDGEGVDIAILDTAPSPHDLIAAYKDCKSWHPLIRTLLGPNGKLKLYPATYEENLRLGSTSLNEHDYKMTDHGLFTAGIVHSIVPKATIHLIEVLNPFGVGDLETLAGGLQKVFDNIYKPDKADEPEESRRRLVVNCSWMLEPPLVAEHRRDPDSQFEQRVMELASRYRDQAFFLKSVCDLFADLGREVIAAAGNDCKEKGDRNAAPATRYPAAFLRTFGVGALPKDSKPNPNGKHEASSYSNLADIPQNVTRIMTLGGEEGDGQGVLGLYLGEFPGCESKPNCTKWAWWAGTSFATPILTGAIAAVLSGPRGPQITQQQAIGILFQPNPPTHPAHPQDKVIIKPHGTDADEAVMEASREY